MKDLEKKLRSWAWERLVFLADRISPEDAFRSCGYSMRLAPGVGWIFEPHDGKHGVKLWYKGMREYKEHSHDKYDDDSLISGTKIRTGTGIVISSELTEEQLKEMLRTFSWYGQVYR